MIEAKKAKKALIALNRAYLMDAYHCGDEEYMFAFNALMRVLERLGADE